MPTNVQVQRYHILRVACLAVSSIHCDTHGFGASASVEIHLVVRVNFAVVNSIA